ncbi:hypothetical protein FF38_14440 [Lucilia cuprina]|uniref:DUF4794 domain-containing protein n=1 Tax=Lucilia cuprina TaxID=7375 RepID=A0A0L0BWC5_LUCCU|nr:hypothetical protein FF38_14440 [Lucilia cuprina]
MSFGRYVCQLILLLFTAPNIINSGPVSSPEIASQSGKSNGHISIQQQQQQQQQQQSNQNNQDAQLNSLNVYASNYDIIASKQNQNDNFKPSYKLPDMETNFTPIHNSNSIAPEFASSLGSSTPVLMQYLPQTINEGGVQYLQLLPTRPLMVPIGPYLTGSTGIQSLAYHQHLAPSNNIDYTTRPLLSALPINMPPPAPSALVDVPASPLPSYGIQSYAANITPYKQNHRINRETKDKQLLGPITLNLNEYIPPANSQQHSTFSVRGRP